MTPATLLLRQAHPKFMPGDNLTSQVFMPFPKDDGKLSVYDGDMISAADAHEHYTKVLKLESHSVWAVTKAESDTEGVPGGSDPLPDFPSHNLLDFTKAPEKSWRKVAKRLKSHASARGCMYRPA